MSKRKLVEGMPATVAVDSEPTSGLSRCRKISNWCSFCSAGHNAHDGDGMIGGSSGVCGSQHSSQCPSPLERLCANEDVWETICSFSSGSSVVALSMASKNLRHATVKTPAFVFLAGLDNDGFLVPWQDLSNILASEKLHNGWHPSKHFCVRSQYTAHALDRELYVQQVVESFLREQPDCIDEEFHFQGPLCEIDRNRIDFEYGISTNFYYGAPARPSSACSDYELTESDGDSYVYQLHNPCERLMSPVVFPPAAHKRTSARIAQRLYASPASPGDDTSSSDGSDSADNSEDEINWVRPSSN